MKLSGVAWAVAAALLFVPYGLTAGTGTANSRCPFTSEWSIPDTGGVSPAQIVRLERSLRPFLFRGL